jgi:hypothetical protein
VPGGGPVALATLLEGAPASGAPDWSGTNNQEAGVEEADRVQTDGAFLYVVDERAAELLVVRSWPADESALVGRTPIGGMPVALFVHGDQALVISSLLDASPALPAGQASRLSVVDLTDRSRPAVVREIDVEGFVTAARRIGDDVYLVLESYASTPQAVFDLLSDPSLALPETYWSASDEKRAAAREKARRLLAPRVAALAREAPLVDLLPSRLEGAGGGTAQAEPLISCTDVYHPVETSMPSFLVVAHLDLGVPGGSELDTTSILGAGSVAYASGEHLYVAQGSWGWWEVDSEPTTRIHRFALAAEDTAYEAAGEVDGWLLNAFSMDEHEGILRVATSDGWSATGEPPANHVFTLERRGSELELVGSILGIAPGEQLQAARFLGEIGFLVTFRQIDPLFTLDLSDAASPRVVGELELPGFSAYLHPVAGDRLLGIGMDGTEDGRLTGLAVALFDVGDLAQPRLLDRLSLDGGSSEALFDHHAVTFHRGVLALPASVAPWDWSGAYASWEGLLAITVGEGSLAELGRVDHDDLAAASRCLEDPWTWFGALTVESDREACIGPATAAVRRSVVIGEALHTISRYGVKVTALDDPGQELARVLFHPAE